jgi:hypothetical protein
LKIHSKDRNKTAFSTPNGHFEFLRLPMGLKNSPSIFQRLMNIVLDGCLGEYSFIYIDDIIVYSKTAEDHLQHLEDIFTRIEQAGLKIKFSKCQLFKHSIDYLGFIVGREGVKVNPNKIDAIKHFPTPTNVKGVQAFLGLIGYFRSFICNFAEEARPLYKLLKKNMAFIWTDDCERAFKKFKIALQNAPILSFPDFSLPFILTTDASAYALGAILTQKQTGREVLISCSSRTLKAAELQYSNTDRELLAVLYGVQQHRSYLWEHQFTIKTDHIAIPYLERN